MEPGQGWLCLGHLGPSFFGQDLILQGLYRGISPPHTAMLQMGIWKDPMLSSTLRQRLATSDSQGTQHDNHDTSCPHVVGSSTAHRPARRASRRIGPGTRFTLRMALDFSSFSREHGKISQAAWNSGAAGGAKLFQMTLTFIGFCIRDDLNLKDGSKSVTLELE